MFSGARTGSTRNSRGSGHAMKRGFGQGTLLNGIAIARGQAMVESLGSDNACQESHRGRAIEPVVSGNAGKRLEKMGPSPGNRQGSPPQDEGSAGKVEIYESF